MKTRVMSPARRNPSQCFHLLPKLLASALLPVAALAQDPFTMVTNDPLVTDAGDYTGSAWGDYDNDGFPDVFVSQGTIRIDQPRALNALYHNERNGTFTKVTGEPFASDRGWFRGGTWGDYDNDGDLDLFAGNATIPGQGTTNINVFYRNLGEGGFEKVMTGPFVDAMLAAWSGTWIDYNLDGRLDLFTASAATDPGGFPFYTPNMLFRNEGDGTFNAITTVPLTTDIWYCERAAWCDYDNDGRSDLVGASGSLRFYHQEPDGSFVLAKEVQPDPLGFSGLAWGDYDNDGLMDLCQGQYLTDTLSLFHNLDNGQFDEVRLSAGPNQQTAAWGDYDNDGYLDLFVTENTLSGEGYNNRLYHNNRDGTFTELTQDDSVVTDPLRSPPIYSSGGSWADYDNDGFLDLLVTKGYNTNHRNMLYHNNGNANHWLLLRLQGTVANASAIGARVKVVATVWGKQVSQMRDVGGAADFAQSDLRAHFGLGDATNVTTLRIEWPSGNVQELADVQANKILTVQEARPVLMSPHRESNGGFTFRLNGGLIGKSYVTEASANLTEWTLISTNIGPTALVQVSGAATAEAFFRVKEQ